MNNQYKQLGWNLWNLNSHWFNPLNVAKCPKCKGKGCLDCHNIGYISKRKK